MKNKIRECKKIKTCYSCTRAIIKGEKYTSITLYPSEGLYLSDIPIT
ncbi:hypothetical protein LCGC14_2718540, partial [marine sediment metagenome]